MWDHPIYSVICFSYTNIHTRQLSGLINMDLPKSHINICLVFHCLKRSWLKYSDSCWWAFRLFLIFYSYSKCCDKHQRGFKCTQFTLPKLSDSQLFCHIEEKNNLYLSFLHGSMGRKKGSIGIQQGARKWLGDAQQWGLCTPGHLSLPDCDHTGGIREHKVVLVRASQTILPACHAHAFHPVLSIADSHGLSRDQQRGRG